LQMERVATKDSIKQDMDRRVGRDVTAKVADVAAASGDETRSLSEQFNAKMSDIFLPDERNWYRLFKRVDLDGSGRISYTEFSAMVRDELRLASKALPEKSLQSLWRRLDEDSSGWVSAGEFGHFMRLGADGMASTVSDATSHNAERTRVAVERKSNLRRAAANEEAVLLQATRRAQSAAKQLEEQAKRLEAALARKGKALGLAKARSLTDPVWNEKPRTMLDSALLRGF